MRFGYKERIFGRENRKRARVNVTLEEGVVVSLVPDFEASRSEGCASVLLVESFSIPTEDKGLGQSRFGNLYSLSP